VLLLVAACGGTPGGSDTTTAGTDTTPASSLPNGGADETITWAPCDDDSASLDCASFKVPFDWENPGEKTFTLRLVRRPASERLQRIGSMLVNPGGPGFGGTYLAESAESFFSQELLNRFDVVAWDPRGTGDSTPTIDCVDDYDPYFAVDPSPENDTERQELIDASRLFAEACEEKSGAILAHVSTNSTARDMDAIRRALGEEKITYFGFSYGSELGATWATLFPATVRAAVLDGAADPDADSLQSGLNQAEGFEAQLTEFLDRCASRPTCVFHNSGKPAQAFDALMTKLDASPLVVSSSRAPVNQAVAFTAVAQAMYSSTLWDSLEEALADAQRGDGAGLLQLNDDYYQRLPDGTYGNELEAFNAISCVDSGDTGTVEDAESDVEKYKEIAPRMWPAFTGGYGCVFWPAERDPRIDITGKGAGPIVVVGTTGDAATPLDSTRKMAQKLEDGRLVVVSANRHTGYGENACVVEAVDTYLITGDVTFSEKAC
jgi:pimeloyl-ACP methyl ester carboxylesterase